VHLELKHLQPLAKGNARLVYEHPQSPRLLIKVMRPDLVERRQVSPKLWFQGLRRYDPYVVFLREIREYVAAYAALGQAAPFAQVVHGLVETDLGLGLVLEAVRNSDGGLAPTIAKLVQQGQFDAEATTALDQFLSELLESDLVIADLHERNLVYALGRDGSRRFVLIDGLGDSNLLPFKSWSRVINRRSKQKRFVRLRKRIAGRVAGFLAGNPMP
jgi:hypothetical protein